MKSLLKLSFLSILACHAANSFADSREPIDDSSVARAAVQASSVAMVIDAGATYDAGPDAIGIYSRKLGGTYKLCDGQRFIDAPAVYGACTAFLINDQQVITSPDCLKGPAACETKKIVFGFQRDNEDLSSVAKQQVYGCKSVDGNLLNNVGGAYRVITLDRPVTGIRPLPLDRTPVVVGDKVYMLSHSHGLALRVSSGTVWESTPTWNRFRAGLSSMRGSEGAPIISERTGGVVGLQTSALNNGVRENPFRGCNELKMCEGSECFLEILGTVSLFQQHSRR